MTTDRAPRTPRARLVLVLVVVPSGTIFFLPSFPVATFRPCKVGPARAARPPLPDTRSSQQTNLIIVWILVCEYIHQTGLHDSARRNSNDRLNQNWCRFELLHAVHFVLDTLHFFLIFKQIESQLHLAVVVVVDRCLIKKGFLLIGTLFGSSVAIPRSGAWCVDITMVRWLPCRGRHQDTAATGQGKLVF